MSLNAKHYVAIGLGFVVFAGYAMHKSTAPSTQVAFETRSGDFTPLSSFENAIVDKPSQVTIGDIASFPTIGIAPTLPVEQISTTHLAIENESAAQQATYDSNDTLSDDNDFEVPEFVDDGDLELSEVMTGGDADQVAVPTQSATQGPNASSAFAVAAPLGTASQDVRHSQLPNSRWKKNPFADQKMAEVARTPTLDFPMGDVSALETVNEDSIIVEPRADASGQGLAVSAQPVDGSFPAALNSVLKENFNLADAKQISLVNSDTADVQANSVVSVLSGNATPKRVPLSEAAGQQAVHHIEYGKSLSRRGAAFAARQEFYSALRVIAQANDAVTGSNEFSKAMSQAILAIKESNDFVKTNAEAEMLLNVASITEAHRSNIIDSVEALSISPDQAMQKYLAYAQHKLDEASGRNAVSAEALFCLGKLHSAVAKSDIIPSRVDVARAIAFHQAALLSDGNNFRSGNELGVLMVRMGQLETAIELFKQSLITQPTPQTWGNLAKTHRRLGQHDLAQLAESEFSMLAQSQSANSATPIHWMPATAFNEKAPMEFHKTQRVATRTTVPADNSKTASGKAQNKIKSIGTRLKELF